MARYRELKCFDNHMVRHPHFVFYNKLDWSISTNTTIWWIYIYIYIYTGCPRRNVPDFGRAFLMLKYTDITQNTYVQS